MKNADPEAQLEDIFHKTADLASRQALVAPMQFVTELDALGRSVQAVGADDATVLEQAQSFARRRLQLIDDRSEYRIAASEMMVLSMVLVHHGDAACEVLKLALLELSNDLSAPGVADAFGRLLKRLKSLARMRQDAGLTFWVEAIANALPD